jgi:hypothetical protein
MEKAIKRFTRNKQLREVFHAQSNKEDTDLFNYLIQMIPCTPRIMQEIYRQTPTASRRTFLAKFSNTRTTKVMMTTYDEIPRVLITDGAEASNLLDQDVSECQLVQSKVNTMLPYHLGSQHSAGYWAEILNGRSMDAVISFTL